MLSKLTDATVETLGSLAFLAMLALAIFLAAFL
jgi:hypothetical protein